MSSRLFLAKCSQPRSRPHCQQPWWLPGAAALQCQRRVQCCTVAAAATQEIKQPSAEWTATQTLDEDRLQELAEQFDRFDVDQ
jgi:hypothetical protein